MKELKKKKKGLSLVEILIAMLILAIAAAGLFSSFVAANRFISRSKRRLAAVNLARQINEDLFKYVKADDWESNLLSCETYPCDKSYSLPAIADDNPLKDFSPAANLHIVLVCDSNNPAQVNNPERECPRSVEITIQWDE